MTKNKYLIISGIGAAVLLIAAGGIWFWQGPRAKPLINRNLTSGPSQNVIPLGGDQPAENSGGLQVNTGNASNLGQLNQNQGQTQSQSAASNDTKGIDPSQFGQYDKYKDAQHALFGDVKVGDGAQLTAGKTAAVYYKGWLTNGQLFDQTHTNSDGSQQPFLFTLGAHGVIPGFEEAIYGMKVGGTRMLIIPPGVGYGAQAQGSIPPNSVLIFAVQLLQVQ